MRQHGQHYQLQLESDRTRTQRPSSAGSPNLIRRCSDQTTVRQSRRSAEALLVVIGDPYLVRLFAGSFARTPSPPLNLNR
jgi:hypothetical protein